MTNKTAYAYTPPGSSFPAFVNLSRNDGGSYTLTVRSQGNGGRDIGSIVLSPEAVESLAICAMVDLHRAPVTATGSDEMVNRFLSWKLPPDFSPDCYIRFDREAAGAGSWPVGTNLLTAVQARAMLEHVLGVTPVAPAVLDLNDDTPLSPACDLSGDKPCEACQ
jgi:hypothetical protein